MDSKELRLFREAYSSIHTPQTEEIQEETVAEEQLDEGLGEKAAELLDKGTKKIQGGLEKMGVPINRTKRGTVTKADQEKRIQQNNSADLFDIVKGHLVSEGLTEEEAIQKMVTMTEEERNAIVEALTPDQEARRRELSRQINKAGTPGNPGVNDPATRKMQGEYIQLQKLKGV
jgi:hypothetical protein